MDSAAQANLWKGDIQPHRSNPVTVRNYSNCKLPLSALAWIERTATKKAMTSPGEQPVSKAMVPLLLASLGMLLGAGCAHPISARHVPFRHAYEEANASVL